MHPGTLQVFLTVRVSQRNQYAGQILAKDAIHCIWRQVVVDKEIAPLAEPISFWYLVLQVTHVTLLVYGCIAQVTKDEVILRQLITNSK